MSPAIEVSKAAPAFTLPNQDGEKVALKDLRGKWVVLYFYPRDNTPGCTTEACDFTAGIEQFAALDARIIGVSPDSPESHLRFIEKRALRVELLSDPDHKVMEKYGAWGVKKLYGKEVEGVIRGTVLIDPRGKVAHHWPRAKVEGHADAVRRKLEALRGA